jgi:hypothetical protein
MVYVFDNEGGDLEQAGSTATPITSSSVSTLSGAHLLSWGFLLLIVYRDGY